MPATIEPSINLRAYGKLLQKRHPRPIHSDKELETAEAELLELEEREGELSPEEREYAELLTLLVDAYNEKHYSFEDVPANEILKALMEQRGLRHKEIAAIIENKGLTTEILQGKRGISKAVAKKLADSLHVPITLFI